MKKLATRLVLCATLAALGSPGVSRAQSVEDEEVDPWTVASIGATVYLLSAVTHEGLGHAASCWSVGDEPLGFSTAVADCVGELSPAQTRVVAFSGAGANLLLASVSGTVLALAPPSSGAAYYATWLTTAVNLFQAFGYMMVGPWVPAGDFSTQGVLNGIEKPLGARIAWSAVGLAGTAGSIFLLNKWGEPLWGAGAHRNGRRMWMTLGAYLVGSTLVTTSALLSRVSPALVLSAGIANFVGTLFLAYIPLFFGSDFFIPGGATNQPPLSIPRSTPWIVAGVASVGLAYGLFGPGVGALSPERVLGDESAQLTLPPGARGNEQPLQFYVPLLSGQF